MKRNTLRWKNICCLALAVTMLVTMIPIPVQADQQYWPEGPGVTSTSAIVMEINSGTILYDKDSDMVNYPASITKILTALIAIENSEMDEVVTFSDDAIDNTPRDSSHIARDYGEQMTMEECLYSLLLASANECAYAIAEHVGTKLGGNYQTFIDMMNEKAQQLGCTNTHFSNSSGLPDKNHYTSAHDMALIASEAYKNETFRIFVGTKKYQIQPTNKHSEITYLANHHQMLHRVNGSNRVYEYCTGGKTGYTDVARHTLVTFAEKDGMSLVCVVMRSNITAQYVDSTMLFEYCFDNFKPFSIEGNETSIEDAHDNKGVLNSYGSYVTLDKNAYIVLPAAATFSDATCTMTDVVGSGKTIAKLEYTYAGRKVGNIDLVASGAVVEDSYFDEEPEPLPDPEKKVLKIKPAYIVAAIIVLAVIITIIILCKRLYDNYYVILHNMEVRRQRRERFRPISDRKRRRRRGDRMFR